MFTFGNSARTQGVQAAVAAMNATLAKDPLARAACEAFRACGMGQYTATFATLFGIVAVNGAVPSAATTSIFEGYVAARYESFADVSPGAKHQGDYPSLVGEALTTRIRHHAANHLKAGIAKAAEAGLSVGPRLGRGTQGPAASYTDALAQVRKVAGKAS